MTDSYVYIPAEDVAERGMEPTFRILLGTAARRPLQTRTLSKGRPSGRATVVACS